MEIMFTRASATANDSAAAASRYYTTVVLAASSSSLSRCRPHISLVALFVLLSLTDRPVRFPHARPFRFLRRGGGGGGRAEGKERVTFATCVVAAAPTTRALSGKSRNRIAIN
jgi:hypothetical protein